MNMSFDVPEELISNHTIGLFDCEYASEVL